ncbi:hypothetical protein BN7_5199 [Wickerhamomyces ciferrii]|uniref:Uncharacterized protein n=1 Tax=Wickerhamomyces ciferrii (strain ATCC 14091 / BCRC 22168 / CBS 111 / JCM 3599 / NBRC 0793 / NRRL Y-1031 F-60-10) TaxID=1206466 RepID=K0KR43_WICCF|nr:uncharacterized protein BN7_5199 [Wickerhamomyces ciferrii]CCH45616.1 hypothetical protein BN7_5199 [Wickerhamomyces ciferrii]
MFDRLSSFKNGNQETTTQTSNINDEIELNISRYDAIEYFQTLSIEELNENFEIHCVPFKGFFKKGGIVRCESKKFCSLLLNDGISPIFKADQIFDIVCFNPFGYERCALEFRAKYQSNWSEREIKFMKTIGHYFNIIIMKKKNTTLDDVISDLKLKVNHAMDQRIIFPNDHRDQEPLYFMYNVSGMNFYRNFESLSKIIHMIDLYKPRIESHPWESFTLIKVVPKLYHHYDVDVDGNESNSNFYLQYHELDYNKPNEIFFFINSTDEIHDTHYKKIIKPIDSTNSLHDVYYELKSCKEMLIQILEEGFQNWFFYLQELLINKHLNIEENIERRPSYVELSSEIHSDSNISEFIQVGYRLDLSNDCTSPDSLPSYDEIS